MLSNQHSKLGEFRKNPPRAILSQAARAEGATTIATASTVKRLEAPSPFKKSFFLKGDDMVYSAQQCVAARKSGQGSCAPWRIHRLTDVIYNISPTEVPLQANIGRGSATSTLHEWQIDELEAVDRFLSLCRVSGIDHRVNSGEASNEVILSQAA